MPVKINDPICPECLAEGKPAARIYEGGMCFVHWSALSAAAKALTRWEHDARNPWSKPEWQPAPEFDHRQLLCFCVTFVTVADCIDTWVCKVPRSFFDQRQSRSDQLDHLAVHAAAQLKVAKSNILDITELDIADASE